jgi:hypothetical protein
MGFVTPEEVWLRSEAPDWFRRSVREAIDAAPHVFHADHVIREVDAIVSGEKPFTHVPWRILCFGRWLSILRGETVGTPEPLAVA